MVQLNQSQIEAVILHRPPFLLVDKIVELVPGRRAAGLKKVCDGDRKGPYPRYE